MTSKVTMDRFLHDDNVNTALVWFYRNWKCSSKYSVLAGERIRFTAYHNLSEERSFKLLSKWVLPAFPRCLIREAAKKKKKLSAIRQGWKEDHASVVGVDVSIWIMAVLRNCESKEHLHQRPKVPMRLFVMPLNSAWMPYSKKILV